MRPQLGYWVEQREGLTGTKGDRRRAKEIRKGWALGQGQKGTSRAWTPCLEWHMEPECLVLKRVALREHAASQGQDSGLWLPGVVGLGLWARPLFV